MKVSIYVICFFGAIVCNVASPLQGEPLIDVDALSQMTMQEIDALASGLAAEELIRTKRSGSGDILGSVTKAISSGVSNKLAFIGQASAGASALFSGGSSKHHAPEGYSYGPPPQMEYHMKSFDFLTLKKSILNTLLQAVKAITGGVTILKGQIIKGGGALVSGVGKLVTTKGEVVTNLGRRIVNSASLVPPKKKIYAHPAPIIAHPSPSAIAHPITSYGPPTAAAYHYAPPTAASIHYGPPAHHDVPSAAPFYGPPIGHNSIYGGNKFTSAFEGLGKHSDVQAGIIVMQPLKNIEMSDSDATPGSQSSFLGGAFQALAGIFKANNEQHQSLTAPSSTHATAPDITSTGDQSPYPPPSTLFTAPSVEPEYSPPPQFPSSQAYSTYSNHHIDTIPPFKPLSYDLNDHSKPSPPSTSYGTPIQDGNHVNLQSMVDTLLQSEIDQYHSANIGPTYDSYLDSFPNSNAGHSNERRQLMPEKLDKIVGNVDKIKLHRSDVQMDNPDIYTQMANAKKATESTANNKPQEQKKESIIFGGGNIETAKSISYELRGNKIIRLTETPNV